MWRFLDSSFKTRGCISVQATLQPSAASSTTLPKKKKGSADALPGPPQSVSGAACLHVAVNWSAHVNGALGLKGRLVFAGG